MNNLNSILIEGNLVRDPLHRVTPKGTSLCTFSLACNRYHKSETGLEQEVSFFEIETWTRLADNCYNLGRKGRGVRVIGRLKQDRWIDTEGKTRSKVTIVAEHVEFKPDFKQKNAKTGELEDTASLAGNAAMDNEDDLGQMMSAEQKEVEEYEAVSF